MPSTPLERRHGWTTPPLTVALFAAGALMFASGVTAALFPASVIAEALYYVSALAVVSLALTGGPAMARDRRPGETGY